MNNVDDLKEKVENAENMEETKQISGDSGSEVPIDEMDQVTGGGNKGPSPFATLGSSPLPFR